MVMTARSMPRLSMCGGALALCLAAGAWLATPLWACPPDESAACDPATPKPAKAPKVAKAPKAPRAVVVQPRTTPAPPGTTFEAYMEGRPAPHDDDVRQRLDQLEQRLNRLTEHLEALSGQRGGGGTLRRQPAPMAGALVPGQHGLPEQQLAERRAMAGQNAALGFAAAQTGQTVVKVYRLPPDKRDSLYQFMARNDVPILVGQADEGIEVHATPHQHEIFGLFFELVHPESGAQGGGSSAAPAQQSRIHAMAKAYEEAARVAVERINRPEVQEKVKQHIEEAMRSYHSQHQSLHDRMHQLHQKAEELHKRAIELQREAAELESKAGEKDKDAERDAALAKAEALQSEADALMEQADAEHEAADSVQELMDELQEQLDEAIAEAEEAAEEAETQESEEDADPAD